MRKAGEESFRRAQSRTLQRVGHHRPLVPGQPVDPRSLGDRVVDGPPRIERAHRILGHQLDPAPPGGQLASTPAQRNAVHQHLAGRRQLESQHGPGQSGLAATGFTGQGDDLAPPDGEVDAVHGPDRRALGPGVLHLQAPQLQQRGRFGGSLRRTRRGAVGERHPAASASVNRSSPSQEPSSSTRRQAAARSGPAGRSAGSWVRQRATAAGQRG